MTRPKRTPLHEIHKALGARMVEFAGYEMPVSYTGILEEHECVRENVGLFDVSHMGEFIVTGADTWTWLDAMVTNNCSKLEDGGVLYTVMCREDGTVIDDLLISRIDEERALVVVNAANMDKDFAHMSERVTGNVTLRDASDDFALIAVQGPKSLELLLRCPTFAPEKERIESLGYYKHFAFDAGGTIAVSRTGYTGERGFEIFAPPELAAPLWNELSENGAASGIRPVGLAARDTLRFEASFCLYGHELDDDTTPLTAGLRWVVKLKKGDFVGRDALVAEKESGSTKKLVGLELEGRNIARQGYAITSNGMAVGVVTSGTFSPTMKKSLCMAYVDAARVDDDLAIEVRKKSIAVTRVDLPFYTSRAAGGRAGGASEPAGNAGTE